MRIAPSLAVLSLLAGCGTLWPTVTTQSSSSQRDVLACAENEVESLGYYVRKDRDGNWIEAKKDVKNVEHRSVIEIRRYDVLWIEVSDKGSARNLRIQARSMSEESTRRGPTVIDQPATENVKRDAQTVADRCGGSAAPST
jgi:hypothetical protein